MGTIIVGQRVALPAKCLFEGRDIGWLSAAETIDRLARVGHDPDIDASLGERPKEFGAGKVHVLKLINENVLETGDVGLHLRVVLDEIAGHHDKIAKINRVSALQLFLVDAVNRGHFQRTVCVFLLFLRLGGLLEGNRLGSRNPRQRFFHPCSAR